MVTLNHGILFQQGIGQLLSYSVSSLLCSKGMLALGIKANALLLGFAVVIRTWSVLYKKNHSLGIRNRKRRRLEKADSFELSKSVIQSLI